MCARTFKKEKNEWKLIQREKEAAYNKEPYIEEVEQAVYLKQLHETQNEKIEAKMRMFRIWEDVMEAMRQARRERGEHSEDNIASQNQDLFDPEQFIDQQFQAFNVHDLKEHQ